MAIPGSPRFNPGQQLSARELQRVADLAARTERMSVTGDIGGSVDDGGMAFTIPSEPEWWIRITGQEPNLSNPRWFYSWETVRRSIDNLGWEKDIQGPQGLYNDLPAVEMNFNENVPVSVSDPVVARARMGDNGYSVIFDYGASGGIHDVTHEGNITFNGSVVINGPISYTPKGSPVNITGNMDNLTLIDGPIGFLNVTFEGAKLAGIVAPNPLFSRRMLYCNTGNATMLIKHQDTDAAETHRIITNYTTQADVLLPPNFWVEFEYDLSIARWRVMWVSATHLYGFLSDPTVFGASIDDYDIDQRYPFQVWTLTQDTDLTGLANGKKGQWYWIALNSAGYRLRIKYQSVTSAAGNRLVTPNEEDIYVQSSGGFIVYCDGTVWHVMMTSNPLPRVTTITDANIVLPSPTGPQEFGILGVPLTAVRTVTLPAASSSKAGTTISVVDKAGNVGATNYLSIIRAGSDTINGGTTYAMQTPYSKLDFVSDGVSRWTINPAPSASASLTSTQIGVGDGSNLLSGTADFTRDAASGAVHTIGALIPGYSGTVYDDTTGSGVNVEYRGRHAGGTAGSPTDTTAGMYLASLIAAARSSSIWSDRARIDLIAASDSLVDILHRVYFGGAWNTALKVAGTDGAVSLPLLTASRVLGLDGSKNVISENQTGTGDVVRATSPTLVTPTLGTPAGGTLTNCTGLPPATGLTGFNGLTAADLAATDELPIYDASATANRKVTFERLAGLATIGVSEGRLTLTSGTSVTTSDVTGAGTLYFTPHIGNRVRLYDGTRWKWYTFIERSLSLSVGAGITSGKNYDVFLWDDAGTLTLELSAAWTNDTTRADALARQDGVYVKSGSTTRLWLGIIRASGSNTTEDSYTKRLVCNAYNAVARPLLARPGYSDSNSATSFTTTSTTYEQANGGTGNRVECLSTGEGAIQVAAIATVSISGAFQCRMGISADNTTTPASAGSFGGVANMVGTISADYCKTVSAGYHYWEMLVLSTTGTSVTIFSDLGRSGASADPPTTYISGHCVG